jgi:hypothetical protein
VHCLERVRIGVLLLNVELNVEVQLQTDSVKNTVSSVKALERRKHSILVRYFETCKRREAKGRHMIQCISDHLTLVLSATCHDIPVNETKQPSGLPLEQHHERKVEDDPQHVIWSTFSSKTVYKK